MIAKSRRMLWCAVMRRHRSAIVVVALLLAGCTTISYYVQSIGGQLRLISHREPIQTLLNDPTKDAKLKQQLRQAQAIRDFASQVLKLPDNDSYRSYVQLQHPYVVWSLFATPEFSLQPEQWCFPIAGCVFYRGYFSEQAAQKFAQALRAQGMDVYVGGVTAYSTLGWFDDPLLSSMLSQGEVDTAATIFHELAHQQVYVSGDTAFNEAFATAVANAGIRRWLRRHGGRAAMHAYAVAWRRKQDFLDLVEETRARLAALYASHKDAAHMRAAKRAIIAHMRTDYRDLKRRWGGYNGYDYWFEHPINNAKLAAVAIYREFVPDFVRLLKACGGDFARFYQKVEEIGELAPEQRHARLNSVRTCS